MQVWLPNEKPKAVIQIVHGIAENTSRYHEFAGHLTKQGYLVVAEDHMGHGKSQSQDAPPFYFHGGWFCAVEDTFQVLKKTKQEHPDIPYFLFGHSMGSFMVRTILIQHPDMDISGCVLCATGWFPNKAVQTAARIAEKACKLFDEKRTNPRLQKMFFGAFNHRIEHPRTPFDWTNRDVNDVDASIDNGLKDFCITNGLSRDMLIGIAYIQDPINLEQMHKDLPVFLIAGDGDPVGWYGAGVDKTYQHLLKAGMRAASLKIYPNSRHELLHEINKDEIISDIDAWLKVNMPM